MSLFFLWKMLNKGSIWFPFSRIWHRRAQIRCHGSVSQEMGINFPEIISAECDKVQSLSRVCPMTQMSLGRRAHLMKSNLYEKFGQVQYLSRLVQVKCLSSVCPWDVGEQWAMGYSSSNPNLVQSLAKSNVCPESVYKTWACGGLSYACPKSVEVQ